MTGLFHKELLFLMVLNLELTMVLRMCDDILLGGFCECAKVNCKNAELLNC